jgi:hypothetical protein
MTLRDLTLKDMKPVFLFLLTVDIPHCDVGVSFHLEDVTEFSCKITWERKGKKQA